MSPRIRLAISATITSAALYYSKEWLLPKLEVDPPLEKIAVAILFLACLSASIMFLDYLITLPYERLPRFRRWYHTLTQQTYMEGCWVDVVLDRTVIDRITGYGFIRIRRREGGGFLIEGQTWNRNNVPEYSWTSLDEKYAGNDLEFSYRYEGASEGGGKAKFYFPTVTEPISYTGSFERVYQTRAARVSNNEINFFKTWRKQLDHERQRKLARANLDKYMTDNEFDQRKYTKIYFAVQNNMPEWYRTFLAYSMEKDKEKKLIEKYRKYICYGQSIASILDIGPAEGALSAVVLEALVPQNPQYHGVEPEAAFYVELIQRLKQAGLYGNRITLTLQTIEGYAERSDLKANFDLVLAFNSLYYGCELRKVIMSILRKLNAGGRFASLHTDIANTAFLNDIIKQTNPALNRDVLKQVEETALAERLMTSLKPGEGEEEIVVSFPVLDDARWERIKNRIVSGDDKSADALNLISFIVDVDRSVLFQRADWPELVEKIKKHLDQNNHQVKFPIRLQIFERERPRQVAST